MRQVVALWILALTSVPLRLGTSLVIVVGVSGVVAILLSVLAVSNSLVRAIEGAGHPDRAIVLRIGATSESGSVLDREAVSRIQEAPGVRRAGDGKPVASADVLTRFHVIDPSTSKRAELIVRGVGLATFSLRPEMKVTEGRRMRPGFYELMVGESARSQFSGLDLHDTVVIRGTEWTIVGVFESGGDARESELLADAETLLSVTGRNAFNSVKVLLETPDSFRTFRDSLASDTSLSVQALRESDYFRQQSEPLKETWSFVAYVARSIMALGAMFGAANTIYSSVSARSVEIATLRAIGFGPAAVVAATLLEALSLALIGALLGTLLVLLLFNGDVVTSRMGAGRIVAQLSLDAGLFTLGIGWACLIGICGGIPPAVRAATRPIAEALREN